MSAPPPSVHHQQRPSAPSVRPRTPSVPIGLSNPLPPPPVPSAGAASGGFRAADPRGGFSPVPRRQLPSVTEDVAVELSDSEIDVSAGDDTTVRTTRPRAASSPHAAFPLRTERSAPAGPQPQPQPATLRANNEAARRREVCERLRSIGRLPTNNEYLSLAILRSIVTMYEEIKTRKGQKARARCVQECFDNPSHLRAGMLAILDLLNPNLVADDPNIYDADNDSLVDELLRLERSLWESARRGDTLDGLPARRAVHVGPVRPPVARR